MIGLIDSCEVCKKYKRNPAKPVVGFPWSKVFNEIVALDIGDRREKVFGDSRLSNPMLSGILDKRRNQKQL